MLRVLFTLVLKVITLPFRLIFLARFHAERFPLRRLPTIVSLVSLSS
ncbi:MAG: hypothetical protein ACLRSW_16820 [Christensenellaceae bacterium]